MNCMQKKDRENIACDLELCSCIQLFISVISLVFSIPRGGIGLINFGTQSAIRYSYMKNYNWHSSRVI